MFVPPYRVILKSIGTDVDTVDAADTVEIPVSLLKQLLSIAASTSPLDTTAYLGAYPDVARAIREGVFKSAHDHYATAGYFEGRTHGVAGFDVVYYQSKYHDISRDPGAATHHYFHTGAFEWREPAAETRPELNAWLRALHSDREQKASEAKAGAATTPTPTGTKDRSAPSSPNVAPAVPSFGSVFRMFTGT